MSFDSNSARAAAFTLFSKVDAKAHTAPGRAAFLDRFEKQVDPDGVLTPEERSRRAEYAKRAYFTALSAKSARVRRARKAAALAA